MVPTPLNRAEETVGLPEAKTTQSKHFLLCCSRNDLIRRVRILFKISRLSFHLLVSWHFSLHLLLILNLLLMGGNVHCNPNAIFSCSMCADIMIWRDKPLQCCACLYSSPSNYDALFSTLQNSPPFPDLTLGIVLHSAFRLPLCVPSPTTMCHLFRGPPERMAPLWIAIRPTLCQRTSSLSSLPSNLLPSFCPFLNWSPKNFSAFLHFFFDPNFLS